jgi:hypothetical protein
MNDVALLHYQYFLQLFGRKLRIHKSSDSGVQLESIYNQFITLALMVSRMCHQGEDMEVVAAEDIAVVEDKVRISALVRLAR